MFLFRVERNRGAASGTPAAALSVCPLDLSASGGALACRNRHSFDLNRDRAEGLGPLGVDLIRLRLWLKAP